MFDEIWSSTGVISEAEIDELLGVSTAVEEETEMGAQLD